LSDPSEGAGSDPLADLRVIELADWIAGPFAASLLADFGADVVKIELPGVRSNSRTNGTLEPVDPGRSTNFAASARNKRSLTLDVRTPRGRGIFLDLIAGTDVLVESFRPGTMERWGLGWEALEAVNPRLVMLRISGYGQTGPWRDRAGFDRVAQAFGGLTYVTGTADGPPVRAGLGVADYGTGMLGAYGVMVALHERVRSGRGQQIDLALYETVLAMQGRIAVDYLRDGKVRERTGNAVPEVAPGDVFRTADDRWLHISASGDALWVRLVGVLERPDLLDDGRFATKASRSAHSREINQVIEKWVGARSADEVQRMLHQAGVACSPIMSIAGVLSHPHVQVRGNVVSAPDPAFGELGMIEPLPRMSRTAGRVRHTGPRLGEHTEEILTARLGLSPEQIGTLRRTGVI
jgi:crotonobetainyl-CoA:carnitine CoA-transferase CaiB-like acyl-CoA transferase